MGKINFDGLNEISNLFGELESRVHDLESGITVSMDDVITESFLNRCSSFLSFDEFLTAGGFSAITDAEFEAIPDADFDLHVKSTTTYPSWEEMLSAAHEEYITKHLTP